MDLDEPWKKRQPPPSFEGLMPSTGRVEGVTDDNIVEALGKTVEDVVRAMRREEKAKLEISEQQRDRMVTKVSNPERLASTVAQAAATRTPVITLVTDPHKMYPAAAPDDLEELEVRQEHYRELIGSVGAARRGEYADFGKARAAADPKVVWTLPGTQVVEGWVRPFEVVRVKNEHQEAVHIRHCHGTEDRPATIEVSNVASYFVIEHCSHLLVEVASALEECRVQCSEHIQVIVGGECPSLVLRDVHECHITLCPDTMRGSVQTANCSGVCLLGVPVSGILSLDPRDMGQSKFVYTATVPSRLRSHLVKGQLVTECHGRAEIPNTAEAYWEGEEVRRRRHKFTTKKTSLNDTSLASLRSTKIEI